MEQIHQNFIKSAGKRIVTQAKEHPLDNLMTETSMCMSAAA
jgi:hypothetical protein